MIVCSFMTSRMLLIKTSARSQARLAGRSWIDCSAITVLTIRNSFYQSIFIIYAQTSSFFQNMNTNLFKKVMRKEIDFAMVFAVIMSLKKRVFKDDIDAYTLILILILNFQFVGVNPPSKVFKMANVPCRALGDVFERLL